MLLRAFSSSIAKVKLTLHGRAGVVLCCVCLHLWFDEVYTGKQAGVTHLVMGKCLVMGKRLCMCLHVVYQ